VPSLCCKACSWSRLGYRRLSYARDETTLRSPTRSRYPSFWLIVGARIHRCLLVIRLLLFRSRTSLLAGRKPAWCSVCLWLRFFNIFRFCSPSRIGQCRVMLQLSLSSDVGCLLLQRRRIGPRMSEPLMPLRCDLCIAMLRSPGVAYDAPVPFGVQCVFHFPVSVALEILTCYKSVTGNRKDAA
jgi:hypothetical protein